MRICVRLRLKGKNTTLQSFPFSEQCAPLFQLTQGKNTWKKLNDFKSTRQIHKILKLTEKFFPPP